MKLNRFKGKDKETIESEKSNDTGSTDADLSFLNTPSRTNYERSAEPIEVIGKEKETVVPSKSNDTYSDDPYLDYVNAPSRANSESDVEPEEVIGKIRENVD